MPPQCRQPDRVLLVRNSPLELELDGRDRLAAFPAHVEEEVFESALVERVERPTRDIERLALLEQKSLERVTRFAWHDQPVAELASLAGTVARPLVGMKKREVRQPDCFGAGNTAHQLPRI